MKKANSIHRSGWSQAAAFPWTSVLLGMVILLGQSVAAWAGDAVGGGWLQGGALGEYYYNATLTDPPSFTRRDVRVDFNWGTLRKPGGSRSPGFADVGNQNFSARWTGQIMPRFSENYVFKVTANTGARLFSSPTNSGNWTTLLDAWNTAGTNVASTSLAAGQTYELKLEYHETTGTPVCRLLWSGASTPEEVLDTATLAGLNVDTYANYSYQLWANAMDGARDEWSDYNGSTDSPGAARHQWLAHQDATNIVFEGASVNNGIGMAGTYLLQFQGRAAVSANVFGTLMFVANGTNYGGTLPFGAGYNAASNLTTATLTIVQQRRHPVSWISKHPAQSRRHHADRREPGETHAARQPGQFHQTTQWELISTAPSKMPSSVTRSCAGLRISTRTSNGPTAPPSCRPIPPTTIRAPSLLGADGDAGQ